MTPTIPMLLNQQLVLALEANSVKPENYTTAYEGESVGLDLYNAGPDLVIRPSMSLMATHTVMKNTGTYGEIPIPIMLEDWLDVDKQERDTVFKTFVPTGLRLALPTGWGAFVRGRGSVARTPVTYRAGVIDPGYTDEIWINVVNISPVPYRIKANEKLPFQLVVAQCATNFEVKTPEQFENYVVDAKRRSGQLGSSDN